MSGVFDFLGVCVALYTVYAATTGAVFARHRAWGRVIERSTEPRYFWAVIAVYTALAIALIVYF